MTLGVIDSDSDLDSIRNSCDVFHDISIFLSQPTCGKLRKIQKSPPKRIVWSFEAVKVKISEIDIFGNIR